VYALHASRAMRGEPLTEAQWQAIEDKLRQPDLIAARTGRRNTPVDEAAPADCRAGE
jgi:hypothetical protein